MPKGKPDLQPRERKDLPLRTLTLILTEAGYRCAVPTCRGILALDMHHLWELSAGGGDEPTNLIALCPTCHALYHRGTIRAESLYVYKSMLVALGRAFEVEAIDLLLFLRSLPPPDYCLWVSGDGVLSVARLIAGGLVSMSRIQTQTSTLYRIQITDKGVLVIDAWKIGDRSELARVLGNAVVAGGDPNIAEPGAALDRGGV